MKSYCYVVLPKNLPLNEDDVYEYVRTTIAKYYIDLEVEPYKEYKTREETLEIAKRRGFSNLDEFETYIQTQGIDEGMEDGVFYYISTYNTQGRWDWIRFEGIQNAQDVEEDFPYSVVSLDGVWYCEDDYGFKPKLNFESGQMHPDNEEPEEKWEEWK